MDEFAVAQIDAAVGGARFVGGEENQISGNQLFAAVGAQPQLVLFIGSTRDVDAVLGKDVLEIAGAVKGLGRCSTKRIRHSNIGAGSFQQLARMGALLGASGPLEVSVPLSLAAGLGTSTPHLTFLAFCRARQVALLTIPVIRILLSR